SVTRIHAVAIADMDYLDSSYDEILLLAQFSADDSISSTGLRILEISSTSLYDNSIFEDDLSQYSHSNTFDRFGHTILVEDVDNDAIKETVVVGRDYLKIFGFDSFSDAEIPLVLDINDETYPAMGGGAGIFDLDGDGSNELIVGCNNGTTFVFQISDLDPDPEDEDLQLVTEWKGDLGSTPGKRGSIIDFDIDNDGNVEAIIADQFGQIIVLGEGQYPEVSITSPSPGYTSGRDSILFEWEISNDSLPIVYHDIYINSVFSMRIGGAQRGVAIPLVETDNNVTVISRDIRGMTSSDEEIVSYIPGAPSVDITSPENVHITSSASITVQYDSFDPQSDILSFEIYANGSLKGITTNNQLTFSLDSEGIWNITVIADDSYGDRVRDSINVIFDQSGPAIEITSHADNSAVSAYDIDLRWTASDEFTSIDYYEVFLDGVLQGNSSVKFFHLDLPFEKLFSIEVFAYDILGHSSSDVISLTRDTIEPSISLEDLSLPTNNNGWYYTDSSNAFIEWLGSDNIGGSGIDSFKVLVNGIQFDNYSSVVLNDTITLTLEGSNDIDIIVYDKAGNSNSDSYIIVYDTLNPLVDITSPENNYETSAQNITIFWDASDAGAGIETIEIIVDGIIEDTFTDTSVDSFLVDIPDAKIYTVTVRVTDFLGNINESTINIEHDPVIPTLNILDPLAETSSTNSTLVNVSWDIINIDSEGFIVIINGTEHYYSNTTFDTLIDLESVFGVLDDDIYHLVNVTVVSIVGGQNRYPDTKFLEVDLKNPFVTIDSPLNLQTISEDSLTVTWTGSDFESGMERYSLWLNDTYIGSWDEVVTSHEIDVGLFTVGVYEIFLVGHDISGNPGNCSIYISLFPTNPEFTIDIPSTILTNDPNFQMTISVTNPSSGIEEISVLADNSEIVYYNDSFQENPFNIQVLVEETVFVAPSNEHNLTIVIYDRGGRSASKLVNIIVDKDDPDVFDPKIDTILLGFGDVLVELSQTEPNLHYFNLTTSDTYGIQQVTLALFNDNNSFFYTMILDAEYSSTVIFRYYFQVDFSEYALGDYTIQISVTDNAGNTLSLSYSLSVVLESEVITTPPTSTPSPGGAMQWILDNLFRVVIPVISSILTIIIIAVVVAILIQRRGINQGWRKVVEAVAYVKKTGLTAAYVPYKENLFDDEQLFGGALTGIVGILGEITGASEVEMVVQTMEYGGKRLLICSGEFGHAILLVSDIKPVLKDLLIKFLLEFELTYNQALGEEMLNLNDFASVSLIVESYFGVRSSYFKDEIEFPVASEIDEEFNSISELTVDSVSQNDNE
ncbi:MAG: Ig-like domain-containing protein, partial [Candidatus Heimdallarchaeota archaeon]